MLDMSIAAVNTELLLILFFEACVFSTCVKTDLDSDFLFKNFYCKQYLTKEWCRDLLACDSIVDSIKSLAELLEPGLKARLTLHEWHKLYLELALWRHNYKLLFQL